LVETNETPRTLDKSKIEESVEEFVSQFLEGLVASKVQVKKPSKIRRILKSSLIEDLSLKLTDPDLAWQQLRSTLMNSLHELMEGNCKKVNSYYVIPRTTTLYEFLIRNSRKISEALTRLPNAVGLVFSKNLLDDALNRVWDRSPFNWNHIHEQDLEVIVTLISSNLENDIENVIQRFSEPLVLGFLQKQGLRKVKPRDLSIHLIGLDERHVILKVLYSTQPIGNISIDVEKWKVVEGPSERYLKTVHEYVENQYLYFKQLAFPLSSELQEIIREMPLSAYDKYINIALNSILNSMGLLRYPPELTGTATEFFYTLLSDLKKKLQDIFVPEKAENTLRILIQALSSVAKQKRANEKTVQTAIKLYEAMLNVILECEGHPKASVFARPNKISLPSALGVFEKWGPFSLVAPAQRTIKNLIELIIGFAINLYALDSLRIEKV